MTVKNLIKEGMADKGDDAKLYNASLKDYGKALRLKPNFDSLYFDRGIVEHWLGDSIKSCADLNKAMTLGCNCSDAIKEFCK